MSTIEASGALVNGLIETITVGLQHDRITEAEAVLAAVRVLRPGLGVLDTFDAWLALKRGRFTDAARLLRGLDADQEIPAIGKALRACCLFAVGDPDWRVSANEVIAEDADPDAVALVRLLIGQPPPGDNDQQSDPAANSPSDETISQLSNSPYLRV